MSIESGALGRLDRLKGGVFNLVNPDMLPLPGGTTLTVNGADIRKGLDGETVYHTGGLTYGLDAPGDRLLRIFDDGVVLSPSDVWSCLCRGPVRYRRDEAEIVEKAAVLGCGHLYGRSDKPRGVEIRYPREYREAVSLLDIFRQDTLDSSIIPDPDHLESIRGVDRFRALETGVRFIDWMHEVTGRGIGECNTTDVLFMFIGPDGEVKNPFFNMPDEQYTGIPHVLQKAYDVTDLLFGSAIQEIHRIRRGTHQGAADIERIYRIFRTNYKDVEVWKEAAGLIKHGIPNLFGDRHLIQDCNIPSLFQKIFALHNEARLEADESSSEESRRRLLGCVGQEVFP